MSSNLDGGAAIARDATPAPASGISLTTRVFTQVETLTETIASTDEQTVIHTQVTPLTDTLTVTAVQTRTRTSAGAGFTALLTETLTQTQLEVATRFLTSLQTLTRDPGLNGVETFVREATETETQVETISLPSGASGSSGSSGASTSTTAASTNTPSSSPSSSDGQMHPQLISAIIVLSLLVSILLAVLGVCVIKRRRARRRWGPPRSRMLFDPEADLPPERGLKGGMEEAQNPAPVPFVVEVHPILAPKPEPAAEPVNFESSPDVSSTAPAPAALKPPLDKKLAAEFFASQRVVTNRQSEDFNPPPRYTAVYGQGATSATLAGLASSPPLPSPFER